MYIAKRKEIRMSGGMLSGLIFLILALGSFYFYDRLRPIRGHIEEEPTLLGRFKQWWREQEQGHGHGVGWIVALCFMIGFFWLLGIICPVLRTICWIIGFPVFLFLVLSWYRGRGREDTQEQEENTGDGD